MQVFFQYIKLSFLKMLAYRLRYYTGILTYLLFVSVHYFIWKAIYQNDYQKVINGFTLSEMVTYICIGWIARSFYFSNIDEELDDLVRTGQISTYLIRPVNLQAMLFGQAIGDSLFRLIFFTPPIAVTIVLFYNVSLPPNLLSYVGFFISQLIGFIVLAQINFLVGLLAFYTKSIDGITRAKYYIVQLFSGLLLPLTFFPSWFKDIMDFLPFKVIGSYPLQFYLGKISYDTNLLSVIVAQFSWIILLQVFIIIFWNKSYRFLTIQGG